MNVRQTHRRAPALARNLAVALAAGLVAGTALPAQLQFSRAEDAVKYRQGALFVLAQHFSRIGAMATGRMPYDPKAALEHAEVVASLSRLPLDGFGAGAERAPARARPEVWTETARFREHNDRFVAESAKLVAAARTNNLDALKTAFSSTAGTCKSCHDAYRSN
jgi:cytochrome c556